jgi:hypothetical protein
MDDGSTVAEVWDGGSTNVGVPCDCPRWMKAISILKGKETKRPMDAFTKYSKGKTGRKDKRKGKLV